MIENIPLDLHKPLLEEFKTGWNREKVMATATAKKAAALNLEYHKGIDGVGKLAARIPAAAFHFWGQKLGYQCWKDSTFVKEFLRDNPSLRVNGGATKLQVGYSKPTESAKQTGLVNMYGRPMNEQN